MELFEALETCRAMRYLRPDPVPEELLRKLVWAATRASSPGNSQGWEFLVLRDPACKRRIGEAVASSMGPAIAALRQAAPDASQRRMVAGAAHLVEHFADVPAWILIGGRRVYPPERPLPVWSTVYPAGQNLLVAARGLGLGATFTTLHVGCEERVREILGIPEEVVLGVMVAVGWPARRFGPVVRLPVEEVIHWDRW